MTTKLQLLASLKKQGFSNKIINAFSKVKREDFVPKDQKQHAYEDHSLSLSNKYRSTISQPYTIAFMLKLLELDSLNNINNLKTLSSYEKRRISSNIKEKNKILDKNKIKILEIGSGSGYVLALMNEISKN